MISDIGKQVIYTGEIKYAFDYAKKSLMNRSLKIGEKYTILLTGLYHPCGEKNNEKDTYYRFIEIFGYYPIMSFVENYKDYIKTKYKLK